MDEGALILILAALGGALGAALPIFLYERQARKQVKPGKVVSLFTGEKHVARIMKNPDESVRS